MESRKHAERALGIVSILEFPLLSAEPCYQLLFRNAKRAECKPRLEVGIQPIAARHTHIALATCGTGEPIATRSSLSNF
jgi:hypothetical protein